MPDTLSNFVTMTGLEMRQEVKPPVIEQPVMLGAQSNDVQGVVSASLRPAREMRGVDDGFVAVPRADNAELLSDL